LVGGSAALHVVKVAPAVAVLTALRWWQCRAQHV